MYTMNKNLNFYNIHRSGMKNGTKYSGSDFFLNNICGGASWDTTG